MYQLASAYVSIATPSSVSVRTVKLITDLIAVLTLSMCICSKTMKQFEFLIRDTPLVATTNVGFVDVLTVDVVQQLYDLRKTSHVGTYSV